MKRGKIIFTLFLALLVLGMNQVSASTCAISAELVNQDPYPAIAGSYVEVLFQLNGIGSSCEDGAVAHLVLDYPFSLDNEDSVRNIPASTYSGGDSSSKWNLVYKIRIDPDAIAGDYEVELRYKDNGELGSSFISKKFIITLEDGRTDFEVHIEDHEIAARNLVFTILNTGSEDIEALTVEVPKQNNVVVKGSNRNIVGDLDSNEYTSADFEAIPQDGEIKLNLYYTDSTNERRMLEKTVVYDSSYFVDSIDNVQPSKTGTYVTAGIILLLVVLFILRKRRKNGKSKRDKFNV